MDFFSRSVDIIRMALQLTALWLRRVSVSKAIIRTLGDIPFEVCGAKAHNYWTMPEVAAKRKGTVDVQAQALETSEPPRMIRHVC